MLDQPLPSFVIKANLRLRRIRLETLQFRYGPEHPLVLQDLILKSLAVSAGLIGLTGSGKSTAWTSLRDS